jgi:hypothetical protein
MFMKFRYLPYQKILVKRARITAISVGDALVLRLQDERA